MLRRTFVPSLIAVLLASMLVAPSALAAMPDVTVTAAPGADGATAVYGLPADWVTGSCTPPSGSHFPIGDTAVLCSGLRGVDPAFDAFQVHVLAADTQPPTIAAGSDLVVGATSSAGAIVTYAPPTVADDRTGVGAPVCSPASGSLFPVGLTVINCSVSDAAGNTTSQAFRAVTVTALAEPDAVGAAPSFRSVVGKLVAPTRWSLVKFGLRVPVSCSAACTTKVTIQTVRRVKVGKRYVTTYRRIGGDSAEFGRRGSPRSLYATLVVDMMLDDIFNSERYSCIM